MWCMGAPQGKVLACPKEDRARFHALLSAVAPVPLHPPPDCMGSQLPMGLTFLDLCGTPFQDENPSGTWWHRHSFQAALHVFCCTDGKQVGRACCATPLVSLQTTVRLSLTQSALLAAARFTTCPLSLCVSGPAAPLATPFFRGRLLALLPHRCRQLPLPTDLAQGAVVAALQVSRRLLLLDFTHWRAAAVPGLLSWHSVSGPVGLPASHSGRLSWTACCPPVWRCSIWR